MTAQATANNGDTVDLDFHDFPAAYRKTHQIHVSEIKSFQSCTRRWDWAYRKGYVPETTPKPLGFGAAFHVGMQAGFEPDTWKQTTPKEKLQNSIDAFVADCERQREKYLKVTHQTKLMEADGDNYSDLIDLGIGMLTYYWLEIHPEWDKWFRPVYTEIPFEVPIVNPDTLVPLTCPAGNGECGQFHPAGAPVTFNGRIDVIIEDLLNGGYYIVDHKTASKLLLNDYILQIDPQVGGYSWAAMMLEIDVRGFLYIEYWKEYPREPKALSRLYKGRAFSTDKNQPTTPELFFKTIRRYDLPALKAGAYDEYIAYLKSKDAPKFHQRFPIPKTKKNLVNIGRIIYDVASQMVDPSTLIIPHVGRFSCGNCAYYQPCLAKHLGEDETHYLNTVLQKVK